MNNQKDNQRTSRGSQTRNRDLGARREFLYSIAGVGLGFILPFTRPCFAQATHARSPAPSDLATGIKGPVVIRGEAEYETWRQSMVWQMYKPDRYPEMIVRPTSVEEIQVAMHYARRAGLNVAVKSGGHHDKANFLHNGDMLLDMWNFRGLEVDPGHNTAWVGPALEGYKLDQELSRFNLAFPVCRGPTVPLGGFLLGG